MTGETEKGKRTNDVVMHLFHTSDVRLQKGQQKALQSAKSILTCDWDVDRALAESRDFPGSNLDDQSRRLASARDTHLIFVGHDYNSGYFCVP